MATTKKKARAKGTEKKARAKGKVKAKRSARPKAKTKARNKPAVRTKEAMDGGGMAAALASLVDRLSERLRS